MQNIPPTFYFVSSSIECPDCKQQLTGFLLTTSSVIMRQNNGTVLLDPPCEMCEKATFVGGSLENKVLLYFLFQINFAGRDAGSGKFATASASTSICGAFFFFF